MPEETGSVQSDLPTPLICGVDQKIIERFLILVRDNYPKADRASFFLEEVAGKTHTLVTANLRDVLSHLATVLSSDTRPEDLEAQLASAEEHFRRAIQEPYAIALGNLRDRFGTVHAEYEKSFHKIDKMKRHGLLVAAPGIEEIQVKLRKIAALASEGRVAKRRNRIDPEWDAGVASYIDAYNQLELLTQALSSHLQEHQSIKDGRQGKVWGIAGVALAVIFFIGSTVLVVSPAITAKLQAFFGIIPLPQ